MHILSRRAYLVSSSVALTTALAGCSNPVADGESFDPPEYTSWIPHSLDPPLSVDTTSALPEQFVDPDDEVRYGIPYEEFGYELFITELPTEYNDVDREEHEQIEVIVGEFDADAVEEALREEFRGLEPAGEDGDFRLFEDGSLGIADGVIVVTSSAEAFEATVEAYRGERSRLVTEDEAFRILTDKLGDGGMIQTAILEPEAEEYLVRGRHQIPDGETTDLRLVRVYEDESAAEANEDSGQELAEGCILGVVPWLDSTVEVDGRSVIVSGTVRTEKIFEWLSDWEPEDTTECPPESEEEQLR